MKYIIIFLLLNIHNLVYSQTETEDIIFKAKLLTTSKFGVKNSLQLIEEIKAQDHKAITLNEQKTYLLIKIYKNQDYKIELDNGVGSVF